MKHNEDLFNISSEYYLKTKNENIESSDSKILDLQKEVLKTLMTRFRNILSHDDKTHDGVLKTKFRYRSTCRDGYKQIDELVKTGNFDSFANEYCIYLGKVVHGDANDSYYEIIWDYKTYFEALSMKEIENGLEVEEAKKYNNSDAMSAIKVFNTLPQKYKLSVIKSFTTSVKKQKTLYKKALIDQECNSIGHNYSDWERKDSVRFEPNPYLGSRDYYVPKGHEFIEVPYTQWNRVCKRCGLVETETKEPKCVREARLKKEKQEKIKQLRKELKELENN